MANYVKNVDKKGIRRIGIPDPVEMKVDGVEKGQEFKFPRLTPILFVIPLRHEKGVFVEVVGQKMRCWHYPINERVEAKVKVFPRGDDKIHIHLLKNKGKRFVELEIDVTSSKAYVYVRVLRAQNTNKD